MASTDSQGREWVGIMEASARADVSRRTIYNWLALRKLTTKRTAGGATRILVSSLFTAETPFLTEKATSADSTA